MLDYIIVGSGLAGIAFAETLLQHKKTFVVFDNHSQNSSKTAGGLYNPVILKRFSEVWNAQTQLAIANTFYSALENKLKVELDFKIPIYRKFYSVEEQNNWFAASDKTNLTPFLSTKIINKKYKNIASPFGYGEVLHTGYVDTEQLLSNYHAYLKTNQWLIETAFDYAELDLKYDHITYHNLKAKHIVFAEGFGMHANPYFNYLPLDGTKGELLVIRSKHLDLDCIINTSIFILPLGNHCYKIGSTYNWEDKTSIPTEEGKLELIEKIKDLISCDFEIINHFAGVRPTVKDRRPLVGTHPNYKNVHILNGLGTRGVMLAPSMAMNLYDYIENNIALEHYINIDRFKSK